MTKLAGSLANSFVSDSAVVLISAFAGGLGGAVLQPAIAYLFDRLRNRREIEKRRERTLRHMLSEHLDFGLKVIWTALFAKVAIQSNRSATNQQIARMLRTGPLPPWEPERIEDLELRDWAERFYKAVTDLWPRLFADPDLDGNRIDSSVAEISDFRRRIIRRMDELNWPEVDGDSRHP